MNDETSQFNVLNDIVKDEQGHNIVSDSFAHEPDGLDLFYLTLYDTICGF